MPETDQTNTDAADIKESPNIGEPIEEIKEQTNAEKLFDNKEEPEARESEDETKPEDDDGEKESEDPSPEEKKEDKSDDDSEKQDDDSDEDEPEDYELSKPDETLLSDADMERIAKFSKEQGLSKDVAEKLVQEKSQTLQNFHEANLEKHKSLVDDWAAECKSDSEIGGENYEESIHLAKLAVKRFGSAKFGEQLTSTGFGNNPEVVRAFARIGRAMESDSYTNGKSSIPPKSKADILFDKSNHN